MDFHVLKALLKMTQQKTNKINKRLNKKHSILA